MSKTVAVIGASKDRKKFGNKGLRAFLHRGWTVYPVNRREETIEGLQCYASILDVPGPLDRVSMYVPPSVGKTLLQDIAAKAPAELFFNPGSEDAEIVEAARTLGLRPIPECSIVNLGLTPALFGDD